MQETENSSLWMQNLVTRIWKIFTRSDKFGEFVKASLHFFSTWAPIGPQDDPHHTEQTFLSLFSLFVISRLNTKAPVGTLWCVLILAPPVAEESILGTFSSTKVFFHKLNFKMFLISFYCFNVVPRKLWLLVTLVIRLSASYLLYSIIQIRKLCLEIN